MELIVVLDSGPLGLLSNPSSKPAPRRARAWAEALIDSGARIVLPEIADYEVRRELLRAGKVRGLARLDALAELFDYAGLTTPSLRKAAELWAEARNAGYPTASDNALDGDVILAAQALLLVDSGQAVVVATTNPGHLAHYVAAKVWHEIVAEGLPTISHGLIPEQTDDMATDSTTQTHDDVDYPSGDGRPMAETPIHRQNLTDLIAMLEAHFTDDPMVYVSGNMFVYYVRGDRFHRLAPDVFLVRGVDKRRRRGVFKTWEEGRTPDLVIELTSPTTREEDLDDKFVLYRDVLNVREYFLFDPLDEYLEPPLQGHRLIEGQYMPIEPVASRLPSEVVGLHLHRDGTQLRLVDPATGRWLLTPKEARERAESDRERAEAAREQAEAERDRVVAERNQVVTRLERAEAQIESLRRELEALRRRDPGGS